VFECATLEHLNTFSKGPMILDGFDTVIISGGDGSFRVAMEAIL